mgnify:FL=1|tara:strand:+ start:279 stop:737 length:459 start_codon:yes stop_codon:yes gene_type:complete
MKIHLIWAQDYNSGIGKKGDLPWNIPEDLKNFKKITSHSTIIMGRKTWESLPIKPLPNRRNIVLTKKNITDIECYSSIENCINKLKNEDLNHVFIIGGATIYNEFIFLADELHITLVDILTLGIDTFFPINLNNIKKRFSKIEEKKLKRWEI